MGRKNVLGTAVFIILIGLFLLLLAGCTHTETLYGIKVTGGGNGSSIVIYGESSGENIYAQKIGPGGERLWGEKGFFLNDSKAENFSLTGVNVIGDDAGGGIVAWLAPSQDRYRPESHLARIDADGQLLWQRDFIYFDQMISDGSGGVIIAFDYLPLENIPGDESAYLTLVRVDSQGYYPWGLQGVTVTRGKYRDNTLQMVPDGAGGVITVWQETQYPTGSEPGKAASTDSLFTQRINDRGESLWGDEQGNGIPVYEFPKDIWIDSLQAVADGTGGVIMTWFQVTEDPSAEKGHQQTWDVVAQRIDADGNILWQPGGVPFEITKADSTAHPMEPALVGDGPGGAIVICRDTRRDESGEASVYAQKVDENGNLLWQAGGGKVSSTSLNPYPKIVSGGTDEVLISYSFREDGKYLHVQKLNSNGQTLWQENGVTITKDGFTRHSIVPDGQGAAVVAWTNNSGKAFVQKVSAGGELLWGEKGIRLN